MRKSRPGPNDHGAPGLLPGSSPIRGISAIRVHFPPGLPIDKSPDAFDMKRLPRKVAQQVRTLLDGSFPERRENVMAFGKPGSGKTHLLCALGQELIRAGGRIYFTPTALLVQDLLRAKQQLKLARLLERLAKYDALILDDIGYVQHDCDEMGRVAGAGRRQVFATRDELDSLHDAHNPPAWRAVSRSSCCRTRVFARSLAVGVGIAGASTKARRAGGRRGRWR